MKEKYECDPAFDWGNWSRDENGNLKDTFKYDNFPTLTLGEMLGGYSSWHTYVGLKKPYVRFPINCSDETKKEFKEKHFNAGTDMITYADIYRNVIHILEKVAVGEMELGPKDINSDDIDDIDLDTDLNFDRYIGGAADSKVTDARFQMKMILNFLYGKSYEKLCPNFDSEKVYP